MADVELLPLPAEFGHPSLQALGIVAENYARANLAPLQAENERLRAEHDALRAEYYRVVHALQDEQARAERQAEALRKLSADLRTLAGGETPDGDGVPVNVILLAEKRLAALAAQQQGGRADG